MELVRRLREYLGPWRSFQARIYHLASFQIGRDTRFENKILSLDLCFLMCVYRIYDQGNGFTTSLDNGRFQRFSSLLRSSQKSAECS